MNKLQEAVTYNKLFCCVKVLCELIFVLFDQICQRTSDVSLSKTKSKGKLIIFCFSAKIRSLSIRRKESKENATKNALAKEVHINAYQNKVLYFEISCSVHFRYY